MRVKEVPSRLLLHNGRRFDTKPYMSGALEARFLLERLAYRKDTLQSLTKDGPAGIVNAGRVRRLWVDSPEYGLPFMSSSDILQADLSTVPYIARQVVDAYPQLIIHDGWTLITRSGTIGRMVYARPDMDGMACSEHVMRVIPDPEKVPPGYLYAFLSSKYGVPIVVSGTYGSIIQSIEPHHIADLPVPRLGDELESRTDGMIRIASVLRSEASKTIQHVASRFDQLIQLVNLRQPSPKIAEVPARRIQARFDAQYHDPIVVTIRERLQSQAHTTIHGWCDQLFLPGIFKRIHIDDPSMGAPYYTGASLFWLEPIPKAILSRKTSLFEDVQLTRGTILVQAFGQEGGLTGRSVWVGNNLDGATTTHMLVRLKIRDRVRAGYLYGYLQSDAAYRQIASLTYGGSIPHLDERLLGTVIVPELAESEIVQIGETVLRALDDRDRALDLEREARKTIEQAIEGAI